MGLNLYWTEDAKWLLKDVYNFIKKVRGKGTAKAVVASIKEEVKLLKEFSEMGQRLLTNSEEKNFRMFIFGSYRIVYEILRNKSKVNVLAVFHASFPNYDRYIK